MLGNRAWYEENLQDLHAKRENFYIALKKIEAFSCGRSSKSAVCEVQIEVAVTSSND